MLLKWTGRLVIDAAVQQIENCLKKVLELP
jgi:hypothetical protein